MVSTIKKAGKIIRKLEHPYCKLYLKDTNILVVEATNDAEYERQHIEQVIENITSFAENKQYLLVIIPTEYSTIGYDGLRTMAQPKAMRYALAKAYVVKNLSQRMMVNFYLNFFRPQVPVRIFNQERQAQAWLLKKYRHLFRSRV